MLQMKKFVIEYWFYRRFFEKDFEEIIITAKTKEKAVKILHRLGLKFYKYEIIREINLN